LPFVEFAGYIVSENVYPVWHRCASKQKGPIV
jgi:hypothetical protein